MTNPDCEAQRRTREGGEAFRVPPGTLDPDNLGAEPGKIVEAEEVVEHCEVLEVRPGDIVIYRPREDLNEEQEMWVHRALRDMFPENKSAILRAGDVLGLVRAEDDSSEEGP